MKIGISLICLLIPLFISCSKNNKPTTQDVSKTIIADSTEITLPTNRVVDTVTFHWFSELCEVNGYYLSDKYTHKELQITYEFCQKIYAGIISGPSVYYPKDVLESNLNTNKLTDEYNKLLHYLDTVHIVNQPFWKELINQQKKKLKMEYELKKMRAEAFFNPSVLLNNDYIPKEAKCHKYATALNSPEADMLKVWEEWANEAKKGNAYPEKFMDDFYEKYHSANYITYAKIDLITFGWWNCVNQYIEYADSNILDSEFRNLFIKVEEFNCEDP